LDGASTNRNAPCPCGSGKRFKHCCGQQPAATPLRYEALAAQRAGLLGRAEALYRRALALNPSDADALHMLGVVQLQRMRYREALDLLWQAAELTRWSVGDIRHNVGIVLSRLLTREANRRQADLLAEFLAHDRTRSVARGDALPRVSVMVRVHGDEQSMVEELDSLAAQTYRDIEVVIAADNPRARSLASRLPFTVRFMETHEPGVPATFNDAAALAEGEYIAFLDEGDRFTRDRIATLVDEIARPGWSWGISLATTELDANGNADTRDPLLQRQRNVLGAQPHSFVFLEHHLAASSSNLFVEREFFAALGGFRDFPHAYVRDFCLRAGARSEPAVILRPLLVHRARGPDTQAAADERDRVVAETITPIIAGTAECSNPFAPHAAHNRAVFLKAAFRAGLGRIVPGPMLRALAQEYRALPDPAAQTPSPRAAAAAPGKVALVVLGMHRSGTSATSRVLNLCGAFIPVDVKPPKLGVNAKGFWEPEAVLELNVRLMHQLGAEWDRIDFALPQTGEIVDEFLGDASKLLAVEYEGRDTIVIKDPRMCVLAPLWHRALTDAGYRPVYVVPMRNPLEVAQSLRARGDMTVREGVALWSAYMERVADFTTQRDDAFYVRFTDLLDDWRSVVARIARRFDVPLDAAERSGEVDRFLEHALRTQRAGEEDLAAACREWGLPGVEAQYRAALARCDADARATAADVAWSGAASRDATAGFVLCIENNSIRDQAILLCESIRRFAGRHRNAPIMAFAPRPGLGVDRETQRRLADMDVTYIDEPLNTTCLDYAPANRVFAGGYAEAHATCDFLIVLDSDTVWLDEPELPVDADAAARPVDYKGSATGGPGDRFEPYWSRLADICGMSLDRLPMVYSTVGNERIRVSYNAGLTVARREKGIFRRCADLFRASLEAGMRPYAGSGMNVFASTGHVGEAGSEFWGSSQAALTLAIWSLTDRVVHYPDHYNVPLHLLAADSDIDPRWLARPPDHLHYHWMFSPKNHEVGMELLARLGLPQHRREWLAARTPLQAEGDEAAGRRGEAVISSPADRESRERTGPSTIRAAS